MCHNQANHIEWKTRDEQRVEKRRETRTSCESEHRREFERGSMPRKTEAEIKKHTKKSKTDHDIDKQSPRIRESDKSYIQQKPPGCQTTLLLSASVWK